MWLVGGQQTEWRECCGQQAQANPLHEHLCSAWLHSVASACCRDRTSSIAPGGILHWIVTCHNSISAPD